MKTQDNSLFDLIYEKEVILANRLTHNAKKYITEDFVEFGSSGKIITYQMLIEHFKNLGNHSEINYKITGFNIKKLGDSIIQATYITELSGKKARRSSLWRMEDDWKMFFHQGTPIN